MQGDGRPADIAMLGDGGEGYKLIGGHGKELSVHQIVYVTNDDFSYRYIQIRITPINQKEPPCRRRS
jgi:hypothetical protein